MGRIGLVMDGPRLGEGRASITVYPSIPMTGTISAAACGVPPKRDVRRCSSTQTETSRPGNTATFEAAALGALWYRRPRKLEARHNRCCALDPAQVRISRRLGALANPGQRLVRATVAAIALPYPLDLAFCVGPSPRYGRLPGRPNQLADGILPQTSPAYNRCLD